MASYGEADYFYLQGEKIIQKNVHIRDLDVLIDIQKLERICRLARL
jgi:hypothetical protein